MRDAILTKIILYNTHLESACLLRCSLRYHSSLLFLGTKRLTAKASSCQPWTKLYVGGLLLQSTDSSGAWKHAFVHRNLINLR